MIEMTVKASELRVGDVLLGRFSKGEFVPNDPRPPIEDLLVGPDIVSLCYIGWNTAIAPETQIRILRPAPKLDAAQVLRELRDAMYGTDERASIFGDYFDLGDCRDAVEQWIDAKIAELEKR